MLIDTNETIGRGAPDYSQEEEYPLSTAQLGTIKLPDTEEPLNDDLEEPETAIESHESHLYENLEQNTFKTTDRLIDDIKADLLFLLNTTNDINQELFHGILKLPGIKYSKYIESTRYIPYALYVLENESPDFETIERRSSHFNKKDQITIIRSILFNSNESTLSRMNVYHVKIITKVKDFETYRTPTKNQYHLIDKDELNAEDAMDLMQEKLSQENDSELVKSALPKIVDEATYVCSVTNKILRIVISAPEFDQDDLHDYEIGPINVRYNKACAKFPDLNKDIPSPSQCLHTLYKVIRGPLLLKVNEDRKSIPITHKSLNANINPEILLNKLQFVISDDDYIPPLISNITIRDQNIIRESYIRKILEIVLLGTKAYSGVNSNPFNNFHFTKTLSKIFYTLGDTDSLQSHKGFVRKSEYINLAADEFYSDEMIIQCYKNSCKADPENQPVYFDNLQAIYKVKSTLKLSTFISVQISLNTLGQKDIDNAYKVLGIDSEQAKLIDDDMLLTMYKTEIAEHPTDGRIRTAIRSLGNLRKSSKIEKYLKYEPLPLQQAYSILEIDSTVDDDVVLTAVMIKKSDAPGESSQINRSLITIAIERKSPELLYNIEQEFPDLYDPITYKEACEYLGVDEIASEFQVITIFQVGNREITKARNALRVIGTAKNSKVIDSFLKTGIIDHNLLPAENWPVGLNNIGNTCYLNSLLQYYFSIKTLRDAVLQFYDIYNGEEIYLNRRIGGRLVQQGEVERSFQFTYQLRDLFLEQIHSDRRCVTPSKELAYLAFLPSVVDVQFKQNVVNSEKVDLIEVEEIPDTNEDTLVPIEKIGSNDLIQLNDDSSNKDDGDENEEEEDDDDVIMIDKEDNMDLSISPIKLMSDNDQEILDITDAENNKNNIEIIDENTDPSETSKKEEISDVQKIEPEPTSIALKIQETEMETAYEIGRQQDVTECIGNVLSQIEAAFKPEGFDENDKEQNDLVKRLFFGETIQHLIDVEDPSIRRNKTDRFSNLFVNISDKPRNLYEAFDFVFKNEEVTIDNRIFNRSERITKLPVILQIQISRVYFDRVKLRPYKSIDPLPFPETLYMDRYLDSDSPDLIAKREESEAWKSEIIQLKQRKDVLLTKNSHDITHKDSLKATKDWLEAENLAAPETIEVLAQQIKRIDEELLYINNTIDELESKIDHQFDEYQNNGYSIFAIFIHRGEANYGHYWIYIKDKQSGMYRKYNDEIVSEVTLQEVFNFEPTNTATPYFLGYIQNGHEADVEPLCRKHNNIASV